VNIKPILVRRDNEGHFILIKGEIHQEEITNFNLYAPSVDAHNLIYTIGHQNTDRPQHSGSRRL
jgi:hypothetical protein